MKITTIGDITEIDERIRVEPGPRRKRAIATAELLSDDVTAGHYYAGKRKVGERTVNARDPRTKKMVSKVEPVMRTGVDATGKPIEIGKEMEYIDWRNRRDVVFYVYQKNEADRFLLVGTHETRDDAMSQATTLAATPSPAKAQE